jgi:micrococcal nuclease
VTNLRHFFYLSLGLSVLLVVTLAGPFFLKPHKLGEQVRLVEVKKVIDGDTIELASGQKVRYIGINTPKQELGDCYAKEAVKRNKELVEGKFVRLEKDVSEKDNYGRLLRYVYLGKKEENKISVNEILIKEGFAQVLTLLPDMAFAEKFLQSEREAREQKLGLWAACGLRTVEEEVLGLIHTASPSATPFEK